MLSSYDSTTLFCLLNHKFVLSLSLIIVMSMGSFKSFLGSSQRMVMVEPSGLINKVRYILGYVVLVCLLATLLIELHRTATVLRHRYCNLNITEPFTCIDMIWKQNHFIPLHISTILSSWWLSWWAYVCSSVVRCATKIYPANSYSVQRACVGSQYASHVTET